jgi:hypothetical protein
MRNAHFSELDGIRLLSIERDLTVAQVGVVCVALWRGAVTRALFDRQRSGLTEVVDCHPEGAGFLCVIESTAKPPEDTELRRASAQMIMDHGDRVKCVACVVEGNGFRSAINRGALTGMVLLQRGKLPPLNIFANVPDATSWFARHLRGHSASDLTSAVGLIRSRVSPASPGT